MITLTAGEAHAGHSGAYSNHSGGAYNSGASGGQQSVGPQQGNFAYEAQGHGPSGHYPSEVPATNASMLRGPLDDVWPSPNQPGISPGQVRPVFVFFHIFFSLFCFFNCLSMILFGSVECLQCISGLYVAAVVLQPSVSMSMCTFACTGHSYDIPRPVLAIFGDIRQPTMIAMMPLHLKC